MPMMDNGILWYIRRFFLRLKKWPPRCEFCNHYMDQHTEYDAYGCLQCWDECEEKKRKWEDQCGHFLEGDPWL
jgi:hypothetical protein